MVAITPQVHQPRMKVFTVGLDDKEKAQKADAEKSDMTKIAIESPSQTPAPSPVILPRSPPPRRHRGCGVLTWVVAAFFIVLLCLTISEITYNRQRDQAFLRLKWAELRQRMLGYELLSQSQQQQPVDERLAFSRHNEDELPERELPITSTTEEAIHKVESSAEIGSIGDARFDFLRALLSKIRDSAAKMGLNSDDLQVHVIEVKPEDMDKASMSQALADGFGEVAVPKQNFGPSSEEDYRNDDGMPFGPRPFIPRPGPFDRESMRPWNSFNRFTQDQQGHFWEQPPMNMPWPQGDNSQRWAEPQWGQQQQWNQQWPQQQQQQQQQWNQQQWSPIQFPNQMQFAPQGPQFQNQWNQNQRVWNDAPQQNHENHGEFPEYEYDESPQMRITHHFDRNSQVPQKIVTELYGENAPNVLRDILGQQQPSDLMEQPQNFNNIQQQSADIAPPAPIQSQYDFSRLLSDIHAISRPHQQQQQQQQQQQFPQQQVPASAIQANIQPIPSIGQQNQFPVPIQNKVPIGSGVQPSVEQPISTPIESSQGQRPWYVADDNSWQQTWDNNWQNHNMENNNNKQDDFVFQPHPVASASADSPFKSVNWVGGSVSQQKGRDSDGIDGFEKQEQFNVPIDIASDAEPVIVPTGSDDSDDKPGQFKVNTWQHTQPKPSIEIQPSDVKVGPTEDKDFLPLRSNEEAVVDSPHMDQVAQAAPAHEESMDDAPSFQKKFDSPFFQIDDPSSFRR